MAVDREFDIIIFGASGYTGRYVIEELAHSAASSGIKWAIAGRNKEKLKESLQIVQEYLGESINILKTKVIEADVKNASSLSNMCSKAKLILNCVGPYKLYGEPVVVACIENGTHHVDLSGEIKYLEEIQAKYFDAAREKKIYIIQTCGFGSIPDDFGISVLKKNFPGDLNSVEYYITIGMGPEGRTINKGTFVSAVNAFNDHLLVKNSDKLLKEKVFKKDLPASRYPLSWHFPPMFYSSKAEGWYFWLIGPNERVIRRSQMFRYNYLNERPFESHGYLGVPSFPIGLGYLFFGSVFASMSLTSLGRSLITKYPSFFTAGGFTNEGPTREQVMNGTTTFTFYGEGWKDKLSDPTDQHTTKPDTRMKLTISGPEPVYALTAICMVQAGITIIQEYDRIPLEGGVLTPGVGFENTSLQEKLEKRGIKFELENIY